MALELPLLRMQRWLQEVIAHPGAPEDALAAAQAEHNVPLAQLGELIRPSATLTPAERVGVYHGMYLLRMKEALAADYPALQHFLGEPAFTELITAYVQKYPSRSYSLNPLSDHLPAFIADADAPTLPRAAFCHDLARLELTISQVFDAKETPPLSPARIAAVAAADWERARLSPVAAHCLLELRYNVNAYLQSVRDQSPTAPRPRRKDSFVLIYRRDYRVYRLELGRPARDLLTALFAGTPLGEAIARTCQHGDRPPSQNQLFRWFRDWVANGIFSSLTIG